ncbi:MAG: methyltransferase domain-containing protein [Chloroflexota bacterium]|nr:MAG: methyltransferase domain-containing protein [Chloroflexota bacterium]
MTLKQIFYPESRFGGFSDVDGTIAFYMRVNALLTPDSTVVDYGCGRGAYGEDPLPVRRDLRILKGKARRVIGLDVDKAGQENPYIDEFHCLDGGHWPLAENAVDLCICDHVLEHLEEPGAFFSEAGRVLKDGAYLCIRTPNLWSYVALASKLVPNRSHAGVLARVKDRSSERDVFPTLYRCNTISRLKKYLRQSGFSDHVVYGFAPEPSYLSFSKAAYGLGVIYQRIVPRALHPVLFAFARLRKEALSYGGRR